MGRTAGIMALGQDSTGHPRISRPIPMGHWDGKDGRPWDGTVWDIPGYPVPSQCDTGMGRTVAFVCGTVQDIPGYPVPSQWDTGMGRTVALRMGQCGTSRDIPFHPNVTPGWEGRSPLFVGQCRTSRDILFHPNRTLGWDSVGYSTPSQWDQPG